MTTTLGWCATIALSFLGGCVGTILCLWVVLVKPKNKETRNERKD